LKTGALEFMDVSAEEAEAALVQVKANCDEKAYQLFKELLCSYQSLLKTLEQGRLSIRQLRKMLFGLKSEKMEKIVGSSASPPPSEGESAEAKTPEGESAEAKTPEGESVDSEPEQTSCETSKLSDTNEGKRQRPGHGRRGANGYWGAQRNVISHPTLKSGDPCPECEKGKVYDNVAPKVIVRFTGQAPIHVTIWELEMLRCNLCGTRFTAPQPAQIGPERWDETAKAMLAMSRYGVGTPFYRLSKLQSNLGMPIPASTQWETVSAAVQLCKPAYDEMVRQAAQADVFHNDDTTARILEYMERREPKAAASSDEKSEENGSKREDRQAGPSEKSPAAIAKAKKNNLKDILKNNDDCATKSKAGCAKSPSVTDGSNDNNAKSEIQSPQLNNTDAIPLSRRKEETNPDDRKGVQTTGIIAESNGNKIALFLTGKKHAGENIDDVLNHRAQGLSPPTLMCDALMRNLPKRLAVLLANCMAHARRAFVDVFDEFPEQCRHLIEQLASVYHNDDIARRQAMSADERLAFHQCKSKKIMDDLKEWLDAQIVEHLEEPNSGLGKAIEYMRNHWNALTLFLKVAGCPIDNNCVERALKKAILSRKNSLFYKTQHGADVGDIYMSLIYTCELNGINAFDYLTSLMRHSQEVNSQPIDWMPWNYQQTLQRRQAA
jgi:transposase